VKLKSLKIKNVKSFRDETEFNFHDDFNIFIGPNGGGKSNLLDIISIGLKYFLFNGYYVGEGVQNSKTIKSINIISPARLSEKLEKYYGYVNDISFIEFTLILEEQDIETIKLIQNHADKILSVLENEFSNGKNLPSFGVNINVFINNVLKNFDLSSIPIRQEIRFKFVNNQPNFSEANINQHVAHFLHSLFRSYEVLRIASNYIENFELPPLLLFFSPYRNLEVNNLSITLSNFNYAAEYEKLFTSSSKDTLNLTRLAIAYFGEKMRDFEVKSKTEAWIEDEEVKLVSKYLNKLGYDWRIDLIDKIKNIYEIKLIKDNQVISIDKASSGEREIINFLFGIFAFNIKNGLIIIDEPELHLHPKWQKILLELFIELSNLTGNQFIISTHSPVFINEKTYNHVFRIYKDHENVSRAITIKDMPEVKVKDLLQLINTTNNEKIYFADAVILVEGITDRIVFQKILYDFNSDKNIEIIEVRGKSNRKKFRKFLDGLKIPNFFIGDFDVITNLDGSEEIKGIFKTNEEKIYKDVIKNKGSKDGKELVHQLEKAVENCDCGELKELWEYIKYLRKEIDLEKLEDKEKEKINNFIESKKSENIYILSKGEIEDYLPEEYKAKDVENAIRLINSSEDYNKWKETLEYKELENLIIEIINKITSRG